MPDLLVPLVAAGGGGLLTLAGTWLKARIDRIGRVESEAREHRFDVYRRLVDLLMNPPEADSKKRLAIDVLLFGSDEVAHSWIAFLDAALEGKVENDTPESLKLWMEMILAMRRDAGRVNTSLSLTDAMAALGIRKGRDMALARKAALATGLGRAKPSESDKQGG